MPEARLRETEGGASGRSPTSGKHWSDRKRGAGGQDYEVKYEAKKTGVSIAEVKKAVEDDGNSRAKLEARLGSRNDH